MSTVSRDLVRAVLEARDHRHNETHAALVGLYQALAAELIQSGLVRPDSLSGRLERICDDVAPDPHGEAAHGLLTHILEWLRAMEPVARLPHPAAWRVPVIGPPSIAQAPADSE